MGKITSRNTLPVNTIENTDVFLISKDNGDGTFTSYKVTGSQMKSNFQGLSNFTEGVSTTSPNNTVNAVILSANTSSTNGDFIILPKGTGAFMLDIPDNTATGGNKRGQYAVDLQQTRVGADRVASGNYSVVLGGDSSRAQGTKSLAFCGVADGASSTSINAGIASGAYSITLGNRATATGDGGVALGLNFMFADATASGNQSLAIGSGNISSSDKTTTIGGENNVANNNGSVAIGGRNNTASGVFSYTFGAYCTVNGVEGRQSRGRALGTVQGETQKSEFYLSKRTTDATATTLTVAGGVASSSNQVILSNNSAYGFTGTIVGKQSGSINAAMWKVEGLIVRGANAASTVLTTSTVTLVSNTPAWGTPTLAADTTNGGLRVQATGAAATNIQWTAVIETTEVIYA